ncbi:MAG: hypothetical protein IJT80_09420, partial [Lachnospiraceae bacterium]|nr:hypothetical protein [Lachnospiraceae bacterium]
SVGNVVDPAATFKANFAGDDNHNSASNVDVTVTVGKANAVAATVTANSRTYDGTEKPLVTVTGTPTGGTMYYALGTNATTAPADNLYTTSIPTATDPGTYYVWYKVKGDGNHSDSEAAYVAVSIVRDHGDVTDEDMPAGGIIPDGIWIAGIRDLKYTGKALKQDYRLYDGNKLLLEKTDYTASYKNNTKAYEAGEIIDPNKAPTLNIRMKGNYREVEPVYFNITRVDIGEDEFRVSDMSTAYTGNKQTPAPVLTWSGKKLRPGTDFTVKEYVENTYDFVGKADETTVYDLTVKGIGNFTGERKITLTIAGKTEKAGEEKTVPVVLMKDVKTPSIPEQAYTGEEYDLDSLRDNKGNKLAFTVIYKNKNTVLVPGTDYEAEFTDAREAGTATLILRGLGANDSETGFCFVGEKRITFKIKGLQITGAKVNGLEKSYQYTGEAIEPVITLEKDGKAIPEADYTVEYINNVKAGTASVMITGHNSCQGTKKADFKITPYDLSTDKGAIVINGGEAITTEYVKGGAQPGVTVTFRGGKLIEGRDYTVKYSNNKQVAKADAGKKAPTVTVTGKGMLKGSKAVPFTIGLRRFVEGNGLTVLASDITAGSKAGTSKIKVLDSDGKELKAGQDYKKEVKYYNAETEDEINKDTKLTEVGTVVKVEITGMGTYTDDKLTGVFRIIAKDNNISKATIRIANQEYTGKEVKITDQKQFVNATIKIGGVTKQLTLGKDFEIVEGTYVRNVKKGTAKVTIHGLKGGEEGLNLGGYKTVTFRIKERSIKEWWEGLLDFFG